MDWEFLKEVIKMAALILLFTVWAIATFCIFILPGEESIIFDVVFPWTKEEKKKAKQAKAEEKRRLKERREFWGVEK